MYIFFSNRPNTKVKSRLHGLDEIHLLVELLYLNYTKLHRDYAGVYASFHKSFSKEVVHIFCDQYSDLGNVI